MTQPQDNTRSQRFAVDLPLRYRPVGEQSWQGGRIANISGSGILFQADRSLEVNTKVELTFALKLSASESSDPGTKVFCLGQIVRIEQLANADYTLAFAAAIRNYRFVREQTASADRPPAPIENNQ